MIKFILDSRIAKELVALPTAQAVLILIGGYLFLFLTLFVIQGFLLILYTPMFLFLCAAIGVIFAEVFNKDDSDVA